MPCVHHSCGVFVRLQNVPVIQDHDQDTTDLVKCMDELDAWERRTEAATVRWAAATTTKTGPVKARLTSNFFFANTNTQHPVLVCGALSGRFDHVLHTVHFLHRHSTNQRQIFLVSTENVACLLGKVWAASAVPVPRSAPV